MESVYHIVTIRVNETSWAHVWRLCSRYLGTGYDNHPSWWIAYVYIYAIHHLDQAIERGAPANQTLHTPDWANWANSHPDRVDMCRSTPRAHDPTWLRHYPVRSIILLKQPYSDFAPSFCYSVSHFAIRWTQCATLNLVICYSAQSFFLLLQCLVIPHCYIAQSFFTCYSAQSFLQLLHRSIIPCLLWYSAIPHCYSVQPFFMLQCSSIPRLLQWLVIPHCYSALGCSVILQNGWGGERGCSVILQNDWAEA
jgi:hypothetical protein